MNTPEEQKKLSDSLFAACKAAGIEKPRYIAQDEDGFVHHFTEKPYTHKNVWLWEDKSRFRMIAHPPYASDWKESLLEWVEPQGGMAIYRTPEEWAKDHKGEPLADVLARHPDSFTIETERNDEGEVTAHFIRNHHGNIMEMIRPDHIADTSKMIDSVDDACKIAYRKRLNDDTMPRSNANIYQQAWSDALAWWDGSDQPSGIESLVCEDIAKRQQVGIAKYGTTLADNPLTLLEGLQHAYEESLDFPIYLKKIITDLTEKGGEKL